MRDSDEFIARDRRSIRLSGYDYGQAGAYFITICTQDRAERFGTIAGGEMRLNDAGRMVRDVWDGIPSHYPGVDIDAFVVMPDHVHGIIILTGDVSVPVGAGPRACPPSDGTVRACPSPVDTGPRACPSPDATPRGCPDATSGCCPTVAVGRAQGPAPTEPEPARAAPAERLSLPDVIQRFKSLTTARYRDGVKRHGWPALDGRLWQRNYHEHIIRDEAELSRIERYIVNNPAYPHRGVGTEEDTDGGAAIL